MNFPMRVFCLNGSTGDEKIEVTIEEIFGFPERTSYDGGYGFRGTLHISVGSFAVNNATIYSSTGALYRFLKSLEQCYQSLAGMAELRHSLERDFSITLKMTQFGHAVIEGEYQEFPHLSNKLIFEIETDQTCMCTVIEELQNIETLFGNDLGRCTK